MVDLSREHQPTHFGTTLYVRRRGTKEVFQPGTMTVFHKVNRSGKSKVLSMEERTLIQTHLPEKYRLITEVLYWSAGRIGEVLSIRAHRVIQEGSKVHLLFDREIQSLSLFSEILPYNFDGFRKDEDGRYRVFNKKVMPEVIANPHPAFEKLTQLKVNC